MAAELRRPVFSLRGDKTPDPFDPFGLNSVRVTQSAAFKVLKAWRAGFPLPIFKRGFPLLEPRSTRGSHSARGPASVPETLGADVRDRRE